MHLRRRIKLFYELAYFLNFKIFHIRVSIFRAAGNSARIRLAVLGATHRADCHRLYSRPSIPSIGLLGIEPSLPAPKAGVLPVYDSPTRAPMISELFIFSKMPRGRIELPTPASSFLYLELPRALDYLIFQLEAGYLCGIIVGTHPLVSTPPRKPSLTCEALSSLARDCPQTLVRGDPPNSPSYSICITAEGPEDSGQRSTNELPRHILSLSPSLLFIKVQLIRTPIALCVPREFLLYRLRHINCIDTREMQRA